VSDAIAVDELIAGTVVSEDDLQRRIAELGADISRDYAGRDLLLIGVL
jgi:hypoxanthine phosphoribosyltransferase